MKKVTAFFRKLNCVGSTLNLEDDNLINLLIRNLRNFDRIKATRNVATEMIEYFTTGKEKNCSILYLHYELLQYFKTIQFKQSL